LLSRVASPGSELLSVPAPAALSRLSLILRNREQAILLSWLHQCGAMAEHVTFTTRALEIALSGLVDRRTAMRVLQRLAIAGLLSIEPLGNKGSAYMLNRTALSTLLNILPATEMATHRLPGWTAKTFRLLDQLSAIFGSVVDRSRDVLRATTGAEDGVAGIGGSTFHAGATLNLAGVSADAAGASAQLSQEA